MITHTITQLPNGDFLLKLLSDGKTVQTTEIPANEAGSIANAILNSNAVSVLTSLAAQPSDPKVCGECDCNRQ